jgi:hypothetical protein
MRRLPMNRGEDNPEGGDKPSSRPVKKGPKWGKTTRLRIDQGIPTTLSIISDDAGQFNIFDQALCWIHADKKDLSQTRFLLSGVTFATDYAESTKSHAFLS